MMIMMIMTKYRNMINILTPMITLTVSCRMKQDVNQFNSYGGDSNQVLHIYGQSEHHHRRGRGRGRSPAFHPPGPAHRHAGPPPFHRQDARPGPAHRQARWRSPAWNKKPTVPGHLRHQHQPAVHVQHPRMLVNRATNKQKQAAEMMSRMAEVDALTSHPAFPRHLNETIKVFNHRREGKKINSKRYALTEGTQPQEARANLPETLRTRFDNAPTWVRDQIRWLLRRSGVTEEDRYEAAIVKAIRHARYTRQKEARIRAARAESPVTSEDEAPEPRTKVAIVIDPADSVDVPQIPSPTPTPEPIDPRDGQEPSYDPESPSNQMYRTEPPSYSPGSPSDKPQPPSYSPGPPSKRYITQARNKQDKTEPTLPDYDDLQQDQSDIDNDLLDTADDEDSVQALTSFDTSLLQ